MPLSHDNAERLALWGGILIGPFAWSVALAVNLPLVREACYGGGRSPLLAVSAACLLVTLGAALLALRRLASHRRGGAGVARAGFMARLGVGSSALFALLIVASALPIFLLSPCPT